MFVHVKLTNRASLKIRPQYSDTKWSILLYDFWGLKYLDKKNTKNLLMSLPGTTRMPSAGFPCRAILCITLCLSPIPLLVAGASAISMLPFVVQPAFADPLDTMKAREFLQKGNNHLNRYEFQQALDAYTECLLCDPNNRNARENIVLTHNNWGIWWFQKRKYKEAREEWEQALKLNPADRNARQNLQVLRVTLSRSGITEEGEKKPPPQKANSDFPPSQIIILTPGLKQSSSSTPSGAAIITGGTGSSVAGGSAASTGAGAESGSGSTGTPSGAALVGGTGNGSAQPEDTAPSAAVIIKSSKTSTATTSGGDASAGGISTYTNGSSANPYSTGAGSGNTPSASSGNTPSASSGNSYPDSTAGKFTTAPAVTAPPSAPSTSSATAGGSQGENIEDMIGQIEQKIYGRKQDSLPIMKRLEKLETDTHGKTKSGTIKERIDTLRKSYGF